MVLHQVVFEDKMAAPQFRKQVMRLLAENPGADPAKGPALYSIAVLYPRRFRVSGHSRFSKREISTLAGGMATCEELSTLSKDDLEDLLAEYAKPENDVVVSYWRAAGDELEDQTVRITG